MKAIARRNFIKRILLAGGTFVMPKKLLAISTHLNTEFAGFQRSSLAANNLLSQAKDAFYRRLYENAEYYYKQVITTEPGNILAYNGLAKVYRAEQRLLDLCRFWEKGWNNNHENVVFMERYARSLVTVVTGDAKVAASYAYEIGSDNLAEKALYVLIDAIKRDPDRTLLRKSLMDAIDKLEKYYRLRKEELPLEDSLCKTVSELTYRYIGNWQEKQPQVNRSSVKSVKPRRMLYFESERKARANSLLKKAQLEELYVYDKLKENPNVCIADEYIVPNSIDLITSPLISRIKKDAMLAGDFRQLCEITKFRYDNSGLFWNTIAYADSLRFKKENLEEAFSLYLNAEKKLSVTPQFKKISAVYMGLAKTFFLQELYEKGRDSLLKGLDLMSGVGGNSLHFIVHYAKSYISEGKSKDAENILLGLTQKYGLTTWTFVNTDPVFRYIYPESFSDKRIYFMQSIQKHKIGLKELLVVLYPLACIYKNQSNPERLKEIGELILEIDPASKYVERLNGQV